MVYNAVMPESQGDQSFRIIRCVTPVSTEVLFGLADEPVVVDNLWPDGRRERRRIVNPERTYQIPTFVFWDETVDQEQQQLIRAAFDELFTAIGFDQAQISYYGNWRESNHRDLSGRLVPHKSIEWQIESKRSAMRRQIDAQGVLFAMYSDPYQVTAPHWEVIFTNKDLFTPETNFVIGGAQPDLGTVISLGRLKAIQDPKLRMETQKTEIFHEFGHVLGLPTSRRGNSHLDHSLGPHCLSAGCSMKQGLSVPRDWINFTQERLKKSGKPLCGECTTDLTQKFGRINKR